ncbi:hypothetical protein HZS_335 [Henneguya salminicola]|nr:hypothetical protein HZS_335 [Henneguya salminicola]
MEGKINTENASQENTKSREELFKAYLKTYSFYYQLALMLTSLFALISCGPTTYKGYLIYFSRSFASSVLFSVIIDFIICSLNFQDGLSDFFTSSLVLIVLYGAGTIIALVLGVLLVSQTSFISLVMGGICIMIVGILLGIPTLYFLKIHNTEGRCQIKMFPISKLNN